MTTADYLELSETYQRNVWQLEEEKNEMQEKINKMEESIDDLTYFLNRFIDEGNKKGQTLEEAYAKMFEIYKSEGYEKYI